MLSALFLLSTAALLPLLVKAEVFPITPSGSDVYNVGTKCQIAWTGDADPATKEKWKNMSIELMTGDNFNMVHITSTSRIGFCPRRLLC